MDRTGTIVAATVLAAATAAGAHPLCNIDNWLDTRPRTAADGATIPYTLRFCDIVGQEGGVVEYAAIPADPYFFVPGSARWVTCPTGGCTTEPDGSLRIEPFVMHAYQCLDFEITLTLQPGLRGARVCEQGFTHVRLPTATVTCDSGTSDPDNPFAALPTCVDVLDDAPGCTLAARIDPPLVAGCAANPATVSAAASAATAGCSGPLAYQWYKDGLPLAGATGVDLDLPPADHPSFASYRCLVSCAADPACRTMSGSSSVSRSAPSDVVVDSPACAPASLLPQVPDGVSCSIDCGNGAPPTPVCTAACSYPTPGSYTLVATSTDAAGCDRTERRAIEVLAAPAACIAPLPATICEVVPAGPTYVDLASCSLPGMALTWTATPGTLDDPASATPRLRLPDAGSPVDVSLTLDAAGTGCPTPGRTLAGFRLLPSPAPSFTSTPTSPCPGIDVHFTASGSAGSTFAWDFGDGSPGDSGGDVLHAYSAAGTFTVRLTETASNGCATAVEAPVAVAVACCAATLGEIKDAVAWRDTNGRDFTFEWSALPGATDGYHTWIARIKWAIPTARDPGGFANSPACFSPFTRCKFTNGIPGIPGDVLYLQVHGVCDMVEGP